MRVLISDSMNCGDLAKIMNFRKAAETLMMGYLDRNVTQLKEIKRRLEVRNRVVYCVLFFGFVRACF